MKLPLTVTSMDRPVNLFRATTTCNTFYIFLSAAKASLLPFLTLFFRLIGLSAMETGIVMAAKTLTGFIWAPLWARCAVAYNKRRTVLVFSLLMMGLMYMSFIAVYYKVGDLQTCHVGQGQGQQDGNSTGSPTAGANHSLADNYTEGAVPGTSVEEPDTSGQPGKPPSEIMAGVNHSSSAPPGEGQRTEPPSTSAATSDAGGDGDAHHSTLAPSGKKGEHASTQPPSVHMSGKPNKPDNKMTQTESPPADAFLEDLKTGLTAEEISTLARKYNVSEAAVRQLIESETNASHSRHARSLNFTFLNNLKDEVGSLTSTLEEKKLLLFLVILLVIIFGEFFSSPVEKIADDAWFDFLERIDDMEKYGRQRYWGSLMFALVPIVVAAVVDYTPCKMMLNLHHFLLHFYVFGVFIIFTLFMAFYFPMPPPVKQKYSSKVGKGLRVICCDGRGFLFVITLLLAGMVYASFNNFLFWRLQDLGSREVTMGLCVSIGAFAETPMLVFSNRLVRKLGNSGVVVLSLLALALRLLYYGFLWTPWAVLPAELTNAFTHTAMWYAVLSYDEFNVGSAMDRSIRSILSSIYFGLGFSLGSFVSGVVYHVYGASILFWGASVVSGVWCLVYSVIQLCLPKKERVKYIKLLRKEEDDSSEGDDDWLEMALKDQ